MSKAVFIGGFCNGRQTVEQVGQNLLAYYSEVKVFRFSDVVNNFRDIKQAVPGTTLVTFSAGALALPKLTQLPKNIYLLNPPLATPVPQLIKKGFRKTGRLYVPGEGLHDIKQLPVIGSFSRSSITENLAHPIANYGQLLKISAYSAVSQAIAAKNSGSNITVVWTDKDVYFKPTSADLKRLSDNNINVILTTGEHDEVVLSPEPYLKSVFGN